uniref:Gustatory receptor n=1 Tax=Ditylenchus dipsaci TaxID=166011 RepID=A0A915E5B8_9BILA
MMALSNLLIYVYEIWRLSPFVTRPCDRLWNTPVFYAIRIAFIIFTIGVNMAFIVLCIERLICICRLASYEESSRPLLISIILTFLTILFSIIIVLITLPGMDWSRGLAVGTFRNDKNKHNYKIFLFVIMITDILGVIFFLFIHNWSLSFRKKIRGFKLHTPFFAAQRSLSVKFQLEETLQMTSLFLPIVISKCIVQVYSEIALVAIGQLWLNPTVEIQMILYEMANLIFLVPFLSIIFIYNGTERSKISICNALLRRDRVSNWRVENANQDDHFIQLKNIFEKGCI